MVTAESIVAIHDVLMSGLGDVDGVREAHGQGETHGVGCVIGYAQLLQLTRGERGQGEVRLHPSGQAEMVVEVGQVCLTHVHRLTLRHTKLDEVRRTREGDMWWVDEETVCRLRVDDAAIRVGVFGYGKETIHDLGIRCKTGHTLGL